MVSSESIKSLIVEARGNMLILMQDTTEVEDTTEWAEAMWLAHELTGYALEVLEKAQHPSVQIDTDRALDNGYPVVCPLTENE